MFKYTIIFKIDNKSNEMVHLIGVSHGIHMLDIGGRRELPVRPSEDFIKYFSQFPRGTKVGLETHSKEDWEDIEEDLNRMASEKHELFDRSYEEYQCGIDYWPCYSRVHNTYWNSVINICNKFGFDVIFLENKDIWFRLNKSFFKEHLIDRIIHKRVLFKKENESGFDHHKKLCKCNNARYRASLKSREIHEIERDKNLLESIAKTGVDIAVVGGGHSNYWIGDKENIEKEFEISFEKYCTDLMLPAPYSVYKLPDFCDYEMIFTQDAVYDSSSLFHRESLERGLRLMRYGKLTIHESPDYVGVWNYIKPMKSYFELFIKNQKNGISSGLIQDILGVASFEGKIDDKHCDIVKNYSPSLSIPSAGFGRREIKYKGVKDDEEFYGRYHIEGVGSNIFYMVHSCQENPLDLAMRLFSKWETEKDTFNQFIFRD